MQIIRQAGGAAQCRDDDHKGEEASSDRDAGGHLFSGLLAFTFDLTEPFGADLRLTLPGASTAAIGAALSISVVRRALCVALRWPVRRFISFALFVPLTGPSLAHLLRVYCTGEQRAKAS